MTTLEAQRAAQIAEASGEDGRPNVAVPDAQAGHVFEAAAALIGAAGAAVDAAEDLNTSLIP
jgi:hypothetical protein